jgi:hypothetical protein
MRRRNADGSNVGRVWVLSMMAALQKTKRHMCLTHSPPRLAQTINPKSTLYIQPRDQIDVIYENQQFAPLFSTRGQPTEV